MNTQKGGDALRVANAIPPGVRSEWMLAAGWIAIILGLMGSATGSGGTMPGFLVALFLDPILWLAGFWFWRYTQVKCSHCGGLNSIDQVAVGTVVRCAKCKHQFAKPGHNQLTQPVQVLLSPIADKNDVDSTNHPVSKPVKVVADETRGEVTTPAPSRGGAA